MGEGASSAPASEEEGLACVGPTEGNFASRSAVKNAEPSVEGGGCFPGRFVEVPYPPRCPARVHIRGTSIK